MRKIISEIFVIIAFILLVVYIADAGMARLNNGHGFLPLTAKDRGMMFGGFSILLFFISFGVGFNIKSEILTILLIAGGALMGTSVLISSLFPDDSSMLSGQSNTTHQIMSPQFLGIIVIGYVIMGLGIWRALKKK